MTCIVGVAAKGKVWMGADSAGVAATWELHTRPDQKMFQRGPMLVGFAGSFRVGQLMQYTFVMPPHPAGASEMEYLIGHFVPAFRACCRDGGVVMTPGDDHMPTGFLLGYRGRLYTLEENFQVGKSAFNHEAIGGGASQALGSLWTSRGYDPRSRVRLALESAVTYNASVKKPFKIMVNSDRGRVR